MRIALSLMLLSLLAAATAQGQVRRLPAEEGPTPSGRRPIRLAQLDQAAPLDPPPPQLEFDGLGLQLNQPVLSLEEPYGAYGLPEVVVVEPLPELTHHEWSYKDGVFQSLTFTGTWLDRRNAYDLGVYTLELGGSLAFPFPTVHRPLFISPAFAVHYLDGPIHAELPPRVYDASVTFSTMGRFTDLWAYYLAVAPGVYSDFEKWDDRQLRIMGYGFGVFTWTDKLKVMLGAAYLDRDDISVVPAAGLMWTPNDLWNFELVAPRPRIARRIYANRTCRDWVYLAGELGGGTWSIQRSDGTQDMMTLSDYRLLLGLERRRPGGAGARLEVGWVFGRKLKLNSEADDIAMRDTVLLRGSVTY